MTINSNYIKYLFQQTYDNAILKCKEKGMELASLETIEENMCAQRHTLEKGINTQHFILADFIIKYLLRNSGLATTYVFIGLSKKGDTGYNKWVNGAPLNYTLGWMPGEPSQPGEECAILL